MKSLIKKTLNKFGWKLIKTRKPPSPNPYGKIDIDVLKAFNDCKGILHLGAHRGVEAEVYNWLSFRNFYPTRDLCRDEEDILFLKQNI